MRKIPKFDYFRPDSFESAVKILVKNRGRIRPLAGGTDLFIAMKEKGLTPEAVLDLKGIKGYDFIRRLENGIEIGALATIRSVETSSIIKNMVPILADASGKIGSIQIRNKATIGGNLCNASPSADTAPALICLKASVEIAEANGVRILPLEDFFTGPGQTVLNGNGLLRKIIIPPPPEHTEGIYFKHSPRKAMDLAIVGVACLLMLDSYKRKCIDSRIVLGAVAPIPLRAKKTEALLHNKEITDKDIEEAGELACQEAKPITDVRGSAGYRTQMVTVFVRRGIRDVLRMIRSK